MYKHDLLITGFRVAGQSSFILTSLWLFEVLKNSYDCPANDPKVSSIFFRNISGASPIMTGNFCLVIFSARNVEQRLNIPCKFVSKEKMSTFTNNHGLE